MTMTSMSLNSVLLCIYFRRAVVLWNVKAAYNLDED